MIYLVMGSPCAGKTTEAKRRMRDGDILIDADLIAQALGSPSTHAHPAHIKALAAHLRDVATLKAARTTAGNVWLVSASPNAQKTIPHDELILVDPGMTTCLARAKNRPSWTAASVREWYAKHDPEQSGKKLRSRQW